MNPNQVSKFYSRCHKYIGPLFLLFRPIKVLGRENQAGGGVVICANHSAMADPLFIALSYHRDRQIHVMAKIELFRVPVIKWFMKKLRTIPIDRSKPDVNSIKTALSYLKAGEMVVIFPEGTRLSEFDASNAKTGALKIAERAGVPIQPVFIPRKKPFFRRIPIIFGEPYVIEKTNEKRSPEDYAALSQELMKRIQSLAPEET